MKSSNTCGFKIAHNSAITSLQAHYSNRNKAKIKWLLLLLICWFTMYCHASDTDLPPDELLGEWRITEIQHMDQAYIELSHCGLGGMSIGIDRSSSLITEKIFRFVACMPNNFSHQCFASPEPGILAPPVRAKYYCPRNLGGDCGPGRVCTYAKTRCIIDNLSDSECRTLIDECLISHPCAAERQQLVDQYSLSIPEPLTGYELDNDRLTLHAGTDNTIILQRKQD